MRLGNANCLGMGVLKAYIDCYFLVGFFKSGVNITTSDGFFSKNQFLITPFIYQNRRKRDRILSW